MFICSGSYSTFLKTKHRHNLFIKKQSLLKMATFWVLLWTVEYSIHHSSGFSILLVLLVYVLFFFWVSSYFSNLRVIHIITSLFPVSFLLVSCLALPYFLLSFLSVTPVSASLPSLCIYVLVSSFVFCKRASGFVCHGRSMSHQTNAALPVSLHLGPVLLSPHSRHMGNVLVSY